jgi:hypothetical protein
MNKRTQPTTLALLATAMPAVTLLLGSHLQAAEPQRYDLAKRASEIDAQAREHAEITKQPRERISTHW